MYSLLVDHFVSRLLFGELIIFALIVLKNEKIHFYIGALVKSCIFENYNWLVLIFICSYKINLKILN